MAHSKSLTGSPSGWEWPIQSGTNSKIIKIVSALNQTHVYIKKAIAGINENFLWVRPKPNIPSAGNIILHMAGTEHQWIGNKIGGIILNRDRDFEFSANETSGLCKQDLTDRLLNIWRQSDFVVNGISDDNATDEILFRLHYTENHLAYHVGQLVFIAKFSDENFQLY